MFISLLLLLFCTESDWVWLAGWLVITSSTAVGVAVTGVAIIRSVGGLKQNFNFHLKIVML